MSLSGNIPKVNLSYDGKEENHMVFMLQFEAMLELCELSDVVQPEFYKKLRIGEELRVLDPSVPADKLVMTGKRETHKFANCSL